MKKIIVSLFLLLPLLSMATSVRELTGDDANKIAAGAQKVRISEISAIPEYVSFREGSEIPFSNFEKWANANLRLPANSGFQKLNSETDKLGWTHYRYRQTLNGIPVEGSMFLLHVKNNMIFSMNGQLFDKISSNTATNISKANALNAALQNVNATTYRWQVASWEEHLKSITNNPTATWYPSGELSYAPLNGNYTSENFRLCYKFDVYAQQPMSRNYVFVDVNTGEVIYKMNRIHHGDVPATAVTAYSGNKSMTVDSVNATTYRLRNSSRGLGVETYNLQQTTNVVNTDFTDADNFWNNVNANQDEYATDAHWGAEMTYDFYYLNFNRNSIDNAGQKLLSYVHYDVDYTNAFWDGTSMTYGDGAGVYTPLTSLEITGHEISHGVTENTCGLVYANESGGMNEGFSDCMGNAIRYFGKQPANIDWLIGNEIGGTPFRSMSNPKQYQNPNCYNGQYWNAPNEVHNNSGVLNYWFYLMTEGGAATNDIGNAYSVVGMGIDTAAAILYRTWAVYLFPNATYADARYYAIQAASDLYGPCTNAVIQTTNAWHAVGIGNTFVFGVNSNFSAAVTAYCQFPAEVFFTNNSNNGGTYLWDFGDGSTSTATSPSHIYNAYGTYDVSLVADGGSCGMDTEVKVAYISIDESNPCIVILNNGTNQTQTTCAGFLYDTGGPTGNYSDSENNTITISPIGASTVTLTFSQFALESNYDYLNVYDGPSAASPLIGTYTGFALPNGGTITSTGSSITIVQTSDVGVTEAGFAISWQCQLSNVAPTANFVASTTSSCSGTVSFSDLSLNGPTSWSWDFGDGATSTLQNPTHTYTTNGVYTVSLTASNVFGNDIHTVAAYITINLPLAPTAQGATICPGTSAILPAVGADSLVWFNAAAGGNALFTGTPFTTPILNTTTTYYVETDIYPAQQYVGPFDNSIGGGNNYTNNTYRNLIFDCFTPVKLVSVKVIAVGAGQRTITLTTSGGTVLNTATVNIPDGTSRVTLNFDLPAGTNLELGATGGVNLFRNNSGAVFPYAIGSLVSITGTNAGAAGYYYFFYDWELQAPPCLSPRTPVTVSVSSTLANFSYTTVGTTYTFADNSAGATTWNWDFGDGQTSTSQNPVHTYTANGTYSITLTVNDGTCTSTTTQTVVVTSVGINDPSQSDAILVYPNPAKDVLYVNFGKPGNSNCVITVNNAIGQTVISKNIAAENTKEIYELNIASFAPGIYELIIVSDRKTVVQKIVKE
jgi:Zn-dependent metalloprotease